MSNDDGGFANPPPDPFDDPPDYPTEEVAYREVPSPGRWRVNWGTGQVVSWYYDERTPDTDFAHFFDTPTACYVDVGDTRVDIDANTEREKLDAVAAALRRHEPDR